MKSKPVIMPPAPRGRARRQPRHSPIDLRKLVSFSSILIAAVASGHSQSAAGTAGSQVKGAWFGQTPPGETPVPFAPAVLDSLSVWVESIAFSPDGTQCFLGVGDASYSNAKLYHSRRVDDVWSPFAEAPFISGLFYSNEPDFSSDGLALTFTGVKNSGKKQLFTVAYTEKGWTEPVPMPSPVYSGANEFRCSYMSDGTMYFGSERSGTMQVYKAYLGPAGDLAADPLGAPVNGNTNEGDPCIAPDGRFLVFYSARDGKSANLYVSFGDGKGGWGPALNLRPGFNTSGDEYGANLSSDGKYLFFTRHTQYRNAIYWAAVSAIEKLRP